ncbi:MAG: spore maturation protein, partial [Deltaproteobacteria bacterium]
MGGPVLNWIWLGLMLISVVYAAFTGRMADVRTELFEGAKSAVSLVIGLVGAMVFFLGLMRVAFDGGLRDAIARAL